MRIGILSDSHGRRELLMAAISALAARGAQAIVHCGDFSEPADIQLLSRPGVAAYAVGGNVDRQHLADLAAQALRSHVTFSTELVTVDIGGGRHLAATHGHDETLLDELIVGGQFPYVCHGHTHSVRDDRYHGTRVICPGALHHSRQPGYPTAALLDTDTDALTVFGVDKPAGPKR
ncbi:MAG: metallophosphoesterase family protein [Planctomycetota bacterium]|nr:metallophosphoesterase family protein [Planctomycetota bacterium]